MLGHLELKEGWASVILLLLLVLIIAWCIQAVQWVDGLSILQGVVLLGAAAGIVLGKSRLPGWMAHLLSALLGVTWVAWLSSRVLAIALELPVRTAVLALDWRLRVWVVDLMTKGESSIGSIFLLVLGLLMWLTAYFAAWAIFRWQRTWWAVIACGVAMMINVTATRRNLVAFLLVFLLLSLLLVVRTSLASYELEWRRERVHYGSELTFGFLRAGLIVSLVAISLAWIVPEAVAGERLQNAWRKVTEPWRGLQDTWSDVFQDLRYSNNPQIIQVSRSMRFGGPVKLTDRPIMDIEAVDGRYWRNSVYHAYTGTGWTNTDPEPIAMVADDPRLAEQPKAELREVLTQTITLRADLGIGATLTAAGDPLLVSIPVLTVAGHLTPTADLEVTQKNPSSTVDLNLPSLIYPRDPLPAGTVFRGVSSVSVADGKSLREAGAEYPDWIVPRYLALPESAPARVRSLAEGITVGLENPFDKVIAIESFLRMFPYNESIAGPKPGQDGVEYFLFEQKEGYCTYYASAMAVMLRAVGVPARYVEGYSHGDRQAGVYHILEKDGHAWPEVYFPSYGWVEFEPTASKPVTSHSRLQKETDEKDAAARAAIPPKQFEEDNGPPDLPPTRELPKPALPFWRRVSPGLWGVLGALVFGAAAGGSLALRRRRQVAGMSAIERVYYDLVYWVGRLVGVRALVHQTPHEYAGAAGSAVPAGRSAIVRIADLYVGERFGGKFASGQDAAAAWRETWPALWRRWVQCRVEDVERIVRRITRLGHTGQR